MAADAESTIRIGIDTTEALASIKNLQRQIAAFHTQLQASGNAANASLSQSMQRNLVNNINATGKFAASLTTVKSSAESFTTALEKNKLSMGEYFRYAGASTKTFGRLFKGEFETIEKVARERVKTVNTQFIKMGRNANGAIEAIKVRPLVVDLESLAGKQAIAAQRQQVLNQLLRQGSTNLLNFGKNTQWAGRQLMVGFTIPLAYLGTVAGKTFMQMEEQALRFKRVYGELFTTQDETDAMVKQIESLAREFTKYGIAVEKTMELAADAAAMGQMGAGLTAQVAEATRLAVLGGVEQAEALKTTISLTDAFGVAVEDLAKKTNFLNAVENQTVVSIEDLTIAIPKAGPVIKQLGGDVEDLAFFLTAMKEGGINASEGANALKSGLASLINPSEKSAKFLGDLGINIKAIVEGNSGNVKDTVIDFANALDTLDPLNRARAIEQLFGKFQFSRLSTLFQNVVAEGTQAERVLKLTRASTEELAILSERELSRIEDSTGYKFKKAIEDLKASLIPLGEQFLKIITPVAEFATKILAEFNKMSDGAKATITTLIAIVGGIGPVALMTFGLLANGIANIIKLFLSMKMGFDRIRGAATGTSQSISYMTQEQLEASAVAASLNQTHGNLIQTFTLEKASIDSLTAAYQRATAAQAKYNVQAVGRGAAAGPRKKYNSGVVSVPGPKGAGDIVPAMLSPGEAVIPTKMAQKYSGLIRGMVNDDIPGFRFGRLGAAISRMSPFGSMLGRSRVAVRTKQQDLATMLQAGPGARYKSAFETGTGADYIDIAGNRNIKQEFLRKRMEQKVFGFGPDTPASARPTYGYARTSPIQALINRLFGFKGRQFNSVTSDFPIGDRGKMFGYKDPKTGMFGPTPNYQKDKLARYGDIDLITKRSVGRRSSAAVTDALMDFERSGNYPGFRLSPVSMRGNGNFQNARFDRLSSPFGTNKTGPNSFTSNPQPPYIETYTPGGFAMDEVSKIIAKDRATAIQLQRLVDESGLRIRVTPQNAGPIVKILSNMFGSRFAAGTAKVAGYNSGVVSVPGPKGKGDVVPAMLSPGEAVIPSKMAEKYRGLISAMISGNIPGFIKGTENFGASAKDYMTMLSQRYANIPEIEPILQKTIDRINAEGIKVSNRTDLDKEIQKDSGRLLALANTTARVSPTTGDSSAMTGLNATHGNAPIKVTPEMARALAAQVGEDSGFGRRLMESAATGKSGTAMSNLVFGAPAGFNRQEVLMSGSDSASFVKKFPKLFMEPIVQMYSKQITGLSADKLGVSQFTEIVSKRLAAVGKKAVTEQMFYKIVEDSIAEMKKLSPSSPALKALEKARNEFRVVQFGGGGGRRGEVTKGLAFNSKGQIVKSSGAQNYRQDASRAAISAGTGVADNFTEKILQRALKQGVYLPGLQGDTAVTPRSGKTSRAAASSKTGSQSTAKKPVKPKKFPGGFDPNRLVTKFDSRGRAIYSYMDENGKLQRVARVDVAKVMGMDDATLRQLETSSKTATQEASVAPKRGNRFARGAGIAGLVAAGAMTIPSMMPSGSQQDGGGIDLMTGAIVASTVASIPMMFGKTIPQVFNSIKGFVKNLGVAGRAVAIIGTVIAAASPLIIKAFTPFKDTEEYADAFNNGLTNNRTQLDAIAKTFGQVASGDIYERMRQNKFTPLSYAPGQTPFGETFIASDQGKLFVDAYRNALSDAGPQAAVAKLSQELSYSIASGIFTVDQARSIAMTIGQQLDDMSIGMNVSANLTGLFGPDGKKLESDTGNVLSNLVTTSGQPLQSLLGNEENFAGADVLNTIDGTSDFIKVADRLLGSIPLIGPIIDSLGMLGPVANGISQLFGVGLDASQVGTFVSATMSTVEAGRQSLATFELIYDEKEATVQKELDHARAIKDTAAEAKALEKLEALQNKRAKDRIALQETFAKQLQAAEDIYAKTTSQGRSDILGGFMDQFTNLYKDSPLSGAADAVKADLEKLKDNPFVVNIAAALAGGAIKPDAFNALLTSLEGKPLETNVLANVSSIIKTQGTQAGGEVINMLNKLSGRSDLQLNLSVLVKRDAAYLDLFSLMATLPAGEDVMEFYLDPKINPNSLEDLNILKGNLDMVDELIKTGDFDMENLLKLDLDIDEAAFTELKENAEYFDKLPDKQKKVFTSVFMSVMPTITDDQINAEIDRRTSNISNPNAADQFANFQKNAVTNPKERAKIAADLAADYAKSLIDYLDLTDTTTGGPKTPTDGGKKQTSFLDGLVRRIRDMSKSTQKLTTGWNASAKAIKDYYKELANGEADDQRGLAQRLREAGVAESLIPGLMDLKATDPKEFAKLFKGGIAGGLSELGQATNRITILTDAIESFGETQSRAARQSKQQRIAIDRLVGSGVSYSDALEMVQDESLLALAASAGFSEELKVQIALFKEAKAAAAGTYEGMTEQFNEAFSGAMDRFAAEEEKIEIALRIDIADEEALIARVEEQIADIQDQNDDLDYGLGLIAEQEENINKTYDDRLEALDKVEEANRRVAAQQQKQVNLAQAISEGDVFAAAKAMQDLEAGYAEDSAQSSRDLLNRERTAKLEALTTEVIVDGQKKKLTRLEIEELIKKNLKEIAQIEEEQLEPAQKRVREATALAEETKRGLTIAGQTRLAWEEAANKITLATLGVTAYDDKLKTAYDNVMAIVDAWNKVKIAQDTAGLGTGAGSGNSSEGVGGSGSSTGSLTDEQVVLKDILGGELSTIQQKVVDAESYILRMEKAGKTAEVTSANKKLQEYLADRERVWGELVKIIGADAANSRLGEIIASTSASSSSRPTAGGGGGSAQPKQFMSIGGFVSGPGTQTSDSIPAMLSNGEYVINAKSTRVIGTDFLDMINSRNRNGIPKFAKGGMVSGYSMGGMILPSRDFAMSSYGIQNYALDRVRSTNSQAYSGDSVYNYEVNVNVKSDANADDIARSVMMQIKQIESQRIRSVR